MICGCVLMLAPLPRFILFFFNDTATTEIYTLSLHDALPICARLTGGAALAALLQRTDVGVLAVERADGPGQAVDLIAQRSEEHTSELQSHLNLVCRLLLEQKKHHKPCTLLTP